MSERIAWESLSTEERNRLIAMHVMNWQERECDGDFMEFSGWQCSRCGLSGEWDDFDRFTGHIQLPPRYTESMDAAWGIVGMFAHLNTKDFEEHWKQRQFLEYLGVLPCDNPAYYDVTPNVLAVLTPERICKAALYALGMWELRELHHD